MISSWAPQIFSLPGSDGPVMGRGLGGPMSFTPAHLFGR